MTVPKKPFSSATRASYKPLSRHDRKYEPVGDILQPFQFEPLFTAAEIQTEKDLASA